LIGGDDSSEVRAAHDGVRAWRQKVIKFGRASQVIGKFESKLAPVSSRMAEHWHHAMGL
jgi:hypothetical protein